MSGTGGTRLLFKKLTGCRESVSTWGALGEAHSTGAELDHEGAEGGKRMGKRRTSQAGATVRAQAWCPAARLIRHRQAGGDSRCEAGQEAWS